MIKVYYYLHLKSKDPRSDKLLMREKSHEFFKWCMSQQTPRMADNLDIITYKNSHGKPYFQAPFDNLWYNISHCNQGFALVISDEVEVGVDIELPRALDNTLELAQRFFHPEELPYLGSLISHSIEDVDAISNNPHLSREFFRMWNIKEAIVKSYGGSIFESKKINTVHRRGVVIKDICVFEIRELEGFSMAPQSEEMDMCTFEIKGIGKPSGEGFEVRCNQISLPQAPDFQLAIAYRN